MHIHAHAKRDQRRSSSNGTCVVRTHVDHTSPLTTRRGRLHRSPSVLRLKNTPPRPLITYNTFTSHKAPVNECIRCLHEEHGDHLCHI